MHKTNIVKVIIGIAVLSLIMLFFINTFEAKGSIGNIEPRTVVVQKGDTLWSIVKTNCSNFGDIREVIYEIRDLNDLETANIFPGQKIKIPSKYYAEIP